MQTLELNHIWLKRWNQDIEGALQGLAEVQTQNQWDKLLPGELHKFNQNEHSHNKKYDEYLDCLLLRSSLLRAQGEYRKSSILIAQSQKEHKKLEKKMNFRMYYELGLDHWCHDDISEALESFSLAEKLARTDNEKLFSLMNLVFCLESLDLDRDKIEKEIEYYLTKVSRDDIKHFEQQHKAYLLRKSFYQKGLIKDFVLSKDIGQAEFFACYLSQLPYMKEQNKNQYKDILLEKGHLWQGSYRLRTLNGFFLLADKKSVRIGDAIDRLYLWTWQWMHQENEINLKKIELTLLSIIEVLDIDQLNKENQLLLRNTLGWIQLLCPKMVSGMRQTLEVLESLSSKNYETLDQEFRLIQKIKMRIVCKKTTNLKLQPPFSEYFEDLDKLPNLSAVLSALINDKDNNTKGELIVDLSKDEVNNTLLKEVTTSPLLARLYFLIFEKGQFKLVDIKENFGTNKRQVYNLFSRARSFLPGLQIEDKNGLIITSIDRTRIRLLNNHLETSLITKKIKHQHYKNNKTESVASISAIKLVYPQEFRRLDLQKTFDLSKATAGRIITTWIEDGIIEKHGQGKGVVYKWID